MRQCGGEVSVTAANGEGVRAPDPAAAAKAEIVEAVAKAAATASKAAVAEAAARDPTSLTFLDLLYAIPLADLATRVSATKLKGIPAEGWTEIALVLVVITFGWVGHHNNRGREAERQRTGAFGFCTLRFAQFLVEVLIIVAYFALAERVTLQAPSGHSHANANWQFAWLAGIFFLYLIWDTLDVKNATDDKWKQRARRGGRVTAAALVALLVCLVLVLLFLPESAAWIAIADCIAIALMYAYRAVQEDVTKKPPP
jgi:hypothetical protein